MRSELSTARNYPESLQQRGSKMKAQELQNRLISAESRIESVARETDLKIEILVTKMQQQINESINNLFWKCVAGFGGLTAVILAAKSYIIYILTGQVS
jgi:hypothetical protein